jgi:hypothetical protein
MPKALPIDWDSLNAAYLKGVPLPELARQSGVSYHALRARAHRYKWRAAAANATEMLQQSVAATMAQRGQQWGGRMANLVEKHLAHLEQLDPSKLKFSELEALARITDATDRTARRTFGLDSEASGGGGVALQVNVNAAPPAPFRSAAIVSCYDITSDAEPALPDAAQ